MMQSSPPKLLVAKVGGGGGGGGSSNGRSSSEKHTSSGGSPMIEAVPASSTEEPVPPDGEPEPSALPLQFDESSEEFRPLDGGCLAWLVCFTSFCVNGTIFSIINCFGIISEWLITQNGASKSMAGSIGSATIGSLFFFSFMASILLDRVGIRPCAVAGGALCSVSLLGSSFCTGTGRISLLLFTHSFLFGLGSALVYTPSLVILGHHFERHLGLANGIVTLGSGVFSVALTRALKPGLLGSIGLDNTFRVLCGLAALLVVYTIAWVPRRSVGHQELNHYLSARSSLVESVSGVGSFLAKFLNVSIWRSRGFVVWTVACPCAMLGYFVPFVFLPNFVQDRTLTRLNLTQVKPADNATTDQQRQELKSAMDAAQEEAAVLLISISVASGVAKLSVGKLADSRCVNRVRLQQVAFCALGLSITLFPACGHPVLAILLALLFGLCDGAFVCLVGPIAFDLVGPSGASQAIGFLLLAMALPTTCGPLLAGHINDSTKRWDVAFYIAGTCPIVAAGIMFLIPQTAQTYPAASAAESFDQTAKSYLDIDAYKEGQARDASGWVRVQRTSFDANSGVSGRRSLQAEPDDGEEQLDAEESASGMRQRKE